MSKHHKDLNASPKKGSSITKLLKRVLSDLFEKDHNHAPMSSNGSLPHKQIDSLVASIPTPFEDLQESPISSPKASQEQFPPSLPNYI